MSEAGVVAVVHDVGVRATRELAGVDTAGTLSITIARELSTGFDALDVIVDHSLKTGEPGVELSPALATVDLGGRSGLAALR